MRELIDQFYDEGLATTFYVKPINFVSKYVKNTILLEISRIFIFILYTFGAISFAVIALLSQLSLI